MELVKFFGANFDKVIPRIFTDKLREIVRNDILWQKASADVQMNGRRSRDRLEAILEGWPTKIVPTASTKSSHARVSFAKSWALQEASAMRAGRPEQRLQQLLAVPSVTGSLSSAERKVQINLPTVISMPPR